MGRALRGSAHVSDVPRHGLARPPPPTRAQTVERQAERARISARAPGAVPSRRLARAAYARDDRARASRGPSAERARAAESMWRSTSSVASSRSSSSSSCSPRPIIPTSSSRRHRCRVVPRGRLHSLVGGRATRLASRPAACGIPSRRPGGAANRTRRVARERRQPHGGFRRDRAPRSRQSGERS